MNEKIKIQLRDLGKSRYEFKPLVVDGVSCVDRIGNPMGDLGKSRYGFHATLVDVVSTEISEPQVEEEKRVADEDTADRLYKVIAHDDQVTTMEFVVRIMVQVFKKPLIFAEAIMWQVHNEGQSVVDVLPLAEAEFRVRQATAYARLEGFPFRFTIEAD